MKIWKILVGVEEKFSRAVTESVKFKYSDYHI